MTVGQLLVIYDLHSDFETPRIPHRKLAMRTWRRRKRRSWPNGRWVSRALPAYDMWQANVIHPTHTLKDAVVAIRFTKTLDIQLLWYKYCWHCQAPATKRPRWASNITPVILTDPFDASSKKNNAQGVLEYLPWDHTSYKLHHAFRYLIHTQYNCNFLVM